MTGKALYGGAMRSKIDPRACVCGEGPHLIGRTPPDDCRSVIERRHGGKAT